LLEPILNYYYDSRSVLSPHLSEAKMQRAYAAPAGLTPEELKIFYNKKMVLWEQVGVPKH